MKESEVLKKAETVVRQRMIGYDSGHDWWHIQRVRKLALYINEKEMLDDPYKVDLASLFHDIADSKFTGSNTEEGYITMNEFLIDNGLSDISSRFTDIIKNVSFSNKIRSGNIHDPILLIIQDADKLDAMGAIGVARAFNYGGFRNNIIYSPDNEENRHSTINHFYDKLLILKSLMNTGTGKELAEERHQFQETFLKQFYKEWNDVTR
jgi:uncharacterized protein